MTVTLTRTATIIHLLETLRQAQAQPSPSGIRAGHPDSRPLHFDNMYQSGSYGKIVQFLAIMWNRRHQLPAISYPAGRNPDGTPRTRKMTASQAYWQLHAYYIDAELHRINVPVAAYRKHRSATTLRDGNGRVVTKPQLEIRRHPMAVEAKARAAVEWLAGELVGPVWLPVEHERGRAA